MNYLLENSKGQDLVMDMEDVLGGVRAPPSEWEWVGSWVKEEKAKNQVAEMEKEWVEEQKASGLVD